LDGALAMAEPKSLRYRLPHVAARIVRHARSSILRLQATWPWAGALAARSPGSRPSHSRFAADYHRHPIAPPDGTIRH
jgi:hypothetical protein